MDSADQNKIELRAIFFDQAEDMFALFDENLNFIDINEAACRNFNLPRDKFIGKNLSEVSPDVKEKGRYKQYKEVIRTGKPVILDSVVHHPSLGGICNRIKVFKVGNGMGGVLTNITDLKNTIEELDTFLYRSSHDMRSPLSSIIGLANLAKNEIKDVETALQYIDMMKGQAERLDALLIKLVESTKIREGQKTVQRIDFRNLIDDVLQSLRYAEGFSRVAVTDDIIVTGSFYSDRLILISVLQNLVDNAIKFRRKNIAKSSIHIAVRNHNNGIRIVVTDNGTGIPPGHREEVFKMFYRASDHAPGSGLGLYTVSNGLKKLGGNIVLESRENEGSTFTLWVPDDGPDTDM